jgi:type IX secretion system PorP/SprF family membrane protein
VGLGLTLINDKIGVHKNLSALTSYAYHLKVGSESYFSMGLQAGLHSRKSDYASLIGSPGNDPKLANPFISHTFLDFGAGAYYRSRKLHLGLSAPELIPQKIYINDSLSIRLSKVNFFFLTKYHIPLNENAALEPGFLIKYLSNVPVSFDINTNFIYRKLLTIGLSYRKNESVDFLLKGQVTAQLQFGYSYDHSIGEVSSLSNGSHELMINYLFRYIQKNAASPR